ncbi:hypothetical protein DEO72_LG1g1998 [Vigna unguiculata]|uniref:Uncharacterized protein n=1 Tax=Vigna unguiculata TaxID=3917 RepID=A0A4D6KK60_VIGUN|nr:hypothetical protein DEO72_LG1g1998 [Vigna unguiculata]
MEKWRTGGKRRNTLADDDGENNGVWRRENDSVGAIVWENREKREKVGAVVWEKREKRGKGMKSVWREWRECCAESA